MKIKFIIQSLLHLGVTVTVLVCWKCKHVKINKYIKIFYKILINTQATREGMRISFMELTTD